MTYRKPGAKTTETKRWRAFCQDQKPLLDQLRLPFVGLESAAHFDDFLMHGYLDHHDDPTKFTVDELTAPQRQQLKQLIAAYLAAGFANPGISLIL